MKRLSRDTLYTENNALELRVQALERRIIPGMVSWAWVAQGTPQSITAATTERIAWDNFSTNNAGLFGTIATGTALPFNNTAGDEVLKMSSVGYALMAWSLTEWEDKATGYPHSMSLQASSVSSVTVTTFFSGPTQESWAELKPTTGDDSQYALGDLLTAVSVPFFDTLGPTFTVHVTNGDSVARNVVQTFMMVYAWPTAGNENEDPRIYP